MSPTIEAFILAGAAAYLCFLTLSVTAHSTWATVIYRLVPLLLALALGFIAADMMGVVVVID